MPEDDADNNIALRQQAVVFRFQALTEQDHRKRSQLLRQADDLEERAAALEQRQRQRNSQDE